MGKLLRWGFFLISSFAGGAGAQCWRGGWWGQQYMRDGGTGGRRVIPPQELINEKTTPGLDTLTTGQQQQLHSNT